MSDYIVKIIPKDPFYKVSDLTLRLAKSFLQTRVRCDFIEVGVSETPVFVDCGENLDKISCPECGAELDPEWWGEAMDQAAECGFTSLKTEMPCCKRLISLNDLDYDFLCGFASALISIFNPIEYIDDKMLEAIENILGIPVRRIEAHI